MLKKISYALLGLLSAIYLINPTLGLFELIPDNLPVVGNLDEAFFAAVLIAVLRYFGMDITKFLKRG